MEELETEIKQNKTLADSLDTKKKRWDIIALIIGLVFSIIGNILSIPVAIQKIQSGQLNKDKIEFEVKKLKQTKVDLLQDVSTLEKQVKASTIRLNELNAETKRTSLVIKQKKDDIHLLEERFNQLQSYATEFRSALDSPSDKLNLLLALNSKLNTHVYSEMTKKYKAEKAEHSFSNFIESFEVNGQYVEVGSKIEDATVWGFYKSQVILNEGGYLFALSTDFAAAFDFSSDVLDIGTSKILERIEQVGK